MLNEIIIKNSFICTYARKSEEDESKQVQSIPDQLKINEKLAEVHSTKIPINNVFSEERSARKPGRPVFNKLMDIIESKEHTVVFTWKFDRLCRNPIDEGRLKWLLQNGKLTIVTPYSIFDVNTNVIVTSVEGASGNQYVIDLSRNVKRGLQSKREKGVPSGVARPGYRNAGTEKGNKWIEPDDGQPNRFLLVQNALRLVLNGTAPMDALRILNDEWGFKTIRRKKLGGQPLSESSWQEMLRDPIYCGHFISLGAWHKIKDTRYKPMIAENEFWTIQELLKEKGRPKPKIVDEDMASFLKMLTCGECGTKMSRDRKRHVRCLCKHKYSALYRSTCPKCGLHESKVPDKRKHEYDFYFCPNQKKGCKQQIIYTSKIEEDIKNVLNEITIPQDFIDWALDYLEKNNIAELDSQEASLQSLQLVYEEKQKELNRLNKLYIGGNYDHEGGEEEYGRLKSKINAEKDSLKKKLDKLDLKSDKWREVTEEGYKFCRDAIYAFEKGGHRTKRDILYSLCIYAVVSNNRLNIEIEAPYQWVQNRLNEINAQFGFTEPAEIGKFLHESANSSDIQFLKTTWLRGSVLYRTRIMGFTKKITLPHL